MTLELQFLHFLSHDLAIPPDAIALAQKHDVGDWRLIPMVLWQYGLATLEDVNQMFDWLVMQRS